MTIDELQKKLSFKTKGEFDVYVSKLFNFRTVGAYQNSSAKKRYENALCNFYAFVKSNAGGEKENKTCTDVD